MTHRRPGSVLFGKHSLPPSRKMTSLSSKATFEILGQPNAEVDIYRRLEIRAPHPVHTQAFVPIGAFRFFIFSSQNHLSHKHEMRRADMAILYSDVLYPVTGNGSILGVCGCRVIFIPCERWSPRKLRKRDTSRKTCWYRIIGNPLELRKRIDRKVLEATSMLLFPSCNKCCAGFQQYKAPTILPFFFEIALK